MANRFEEHFPTPLPRDHGFLSIFSRRRPHRRCFLTAPVPLAFWSIFSSVTRLKSLSYLSLLPPGTVPDCTYFPRNLHQLIVRSASLFTQAFVAQSLAHITKLLFAVKCYGASANSAVVPPGRTRPV
ncbi:hypothetical protein MJO28_016429 [Puccinia striiformis f. sp. tritici]|uniref:Uncharacterized protein n=1 Tax=Puccinia striiformis f. sp. tritici TaxID=168172 RepID=A0ACC0DPI6_9BASI|nr:hypothetical protein MJO28_016429 [Puccinia striiformis f. sp. tritici]